MYEIKYELPILDLMIVFLTMLSIFISTYLAIKLNKVHKHLKKTLPPKDI